MLAFPVSQQFTPQLATWNTYDGQNNWTQPGDAGDLQGSSLAGEANVSGAGTANLDITALAQGWLDGSTPVPSVILSPYATAGSEALFYKQASGASGPSLLLYWMPRLGEPRGATVESTPLTDRMSLGVNVANGNLMVQNNDLHIAGNGIDETVDRTWNSLDPGF